MQLTCHPSFNTPTDGQWRRGLQLIRQVQNGSQPDTPLFSGTNSRSGIEFRLLLIEIEKSNGTIPFALSLSKGEQFTLRQATKVAKKWHMKHPVVINTKYWRILYNIGNIPAVGRPFMVAVKRILGAEIEKYLNNQLGGGGALLLSGARQVGKTTLIKNVLEGKDAIIVNLYEQTQLPRLIDSTESFEEFERLLLRELNFRSGLGTVLVFDEAQEAKRIGRWVGFFKEKWGNQKVIVSGSILSNLFEEGVAYPVGRIDELTLRPFTFKEFLDVTKNSGLKEILEETTFQKPLSDPDIKSFIKIYLAYLQTGGMPDIAIGVTDGLIQPFDGWDRLLRQYALDVERHMGEIYRAMFVSALDRIADITCHPIKNSQIISTDSPSYRKLPQLLEIAEKWHLVHKVPLQTKHPESTGGAASKRYVFDVGLANFFISQSRPVEWRERGDVGNLVYPKLQENFICQELLATNPRPTTALSYYKETRNSQEVDFIFRIANRVIPLEVKSQNSISRNSLIPLVNFLEQRNLEFGILVYNGKMANLSIHNKTIYAIPPFLVSELPRMLA